MTDGVRFCSLEGGRVDRLTYIGSTLVLLLRAPLSGDDVDTSTDKPALLHWFCYMHVLLRFFFGVEDSGGGESLKASSGYAIELTFRALVEIRHFFTAAFF